MNRHDLTSHIYTLDNFLTPEACLAFIQQTENLGYEPATIMTDHGPRLAEHVRNNNRVMFKDVALAEQLWQRLGEQAPAPLSDSVAYGLNELFRFYRYRPGQKFRKHRDASYIKSATEGSLFTFMIYLNDDFTGGETTFNEIVVKPKTGSALIFRHALEHEGTEVLTGVKYVLRTDIMFTLTKKTKSK
ncbi:prolyl hydroxylase family protein [Chryseolinea lacunae]|uniref:2OG-Fe(II) oxygenase n=1 Tax=Chryseolinea lacunae TaxID=2801331 RepID=A0ABS1KRJ2_9BACT|nr:2OG-Fe(II) oxygenase [Chryseolinea lacunae]MBL0742046.1 2OG-Fe(II) oxygenase [Chryseolinea lacunae]